MFVGEPREFLFRISGQGVRTPFEALEGLPVLVDKSVEFPGEMRDQFVHVVDPGLLDDQRFERIGLIRRRCDDVKNVQRAADLLGEAGITPADTIVAYDDTHGVFAARLLVTAELYGHDPAKLHLLDGDYSVWNRTEPTTTDVPDPDTVPYSAAFDPDGPLVDRAAIEAALDDPDAVIVDTREAHEYEAGHIPGAVRLDWRELVDADARTVRPETELRALLEERGVRPGARVVLYCNTARRISHTYTVLRALGYHDVDFYEGSLTEWEREGGAIETVE